MALQAERGVECLVVEGGPGLNHTLISRQLVDEIFLTVAPELLGGSAEETLTLLQGPALPTRDRPTLDLVSVHLAGDELFLRYSIAQTADLVALEQAPGSRPTTIALPAAPAAILLAGE